MTYLTAWVPAEYPDRVEKHGGASDELEWTGDSAAVLAWAEAAQAGRDVWPPGYIALSATDQDGWRYRVTVRESEGRLVVSALNFEAPEGSEGNLSRKLRDVSVPAILRAAVEWEEELRNPDQARLRREFIAQTNRLATKAPDELRRGWVEAGGDPAEYPEDFAAAFSRDLGSFEFPPTSFFPPPSVERMDARKSRKRKGRGRVLDRDHYARVACNYLEAARWTDKPNRLIATMYDRHGHEWKGTTAKQVADWVRIAASARFGFLGGRRQGSTAAEPTEALFEWAKEHSDDAHARAFLERFTKEER